MRTEDVKSKSQQCGLSGVSFVDVELKVEFRCPRLQVWA